MPDKSKCEISLACELCGRPINIIVKLGDLPEQIPNLLDLKERTYRQGMCQTCKDDLAEGCVLFVDTIGRCVKVKAEAAREKIQKEYWGRVVRIPRSALQELINAYLREHPEETKPPTADLNQGQSL